jgi:hypothetical protein
MSAKFPWQSPYVGFDNNPILYPDPTGGETEWHKDEEGNLVSDKGDNEYTLSKFLHVGINEARDMILNQGLDLKGNSGNQLAVVPNQTLLIFDEIQGIDVTYEPMESVERNEWNEDVKYIILHRTVAPTAESTLRAWRKRKKRSSSGTNFLVGKDGTIYQTGSIRKHTIHLYDSPKQMYKEYYKVIKNQNSIGIEVVGSYNEETKTWEPLTVEQAEAVRLLVDRLLYMYDLDPSAIYTHEEIQRKTPGEGQVVKDAIGY